MIKRRWPDTIFFAVVGLGLFSWAVSLFHSSFFWCAVAAVFGLAILFLAVLGPASGPCPLCGKMLHGLFALTIGEFERCPHCLSYFRHSDRKEVPVDHISATPVFSIPIGQGESLPSFCSVCAATAECVKEVVHRSEGRVSHASPMVMKTQIRIPVPYCGKHDNNVQICNEDLAPSLPLLSGPSKTDHRWVLKVRSYGFYREAVLR